MLHFKGTLKVKWLSFWELWGTLLLLQGYKLLPNSTSKSVHECILQTRAATIIARRIWMAEPHTGLENMWSAVVSTGEALLLHQLHPTSTACCCSVSATLGIYPVLSVEETKSRFTSRHSEFSIVWSNLWATAQPTFSSSYIAFTLPCISLNASTSKQAQLQNMKFLKATQRQFVLPHVIRTDLMLKLPIRAHSFFISWFSDVSLTRYELKSQSLFPASWKRGLAN